MNFFKRSSPPRAHSVELWRDARTRATWLTIRDSVMSPFFAYPSTLASSIFVSVSLTASRSLSTVKSPFPAQSLKMSHGQQYSGVAVAEVMTIQGMSSPAQSLLAANSRRHQPLLRHELKSQIAPSSDSCLTGGTRIHIIVLRARYEGMLLTAALSWATRSPLLRGGRRGPRTPLRQRLRDGAVVDPQVHVRSCFSTPCPA